MHDMCRADCSASHQGDGVALADPPAKGLVDVGILNGRLACCGPTRCAVTASGGCAAADGKLIAAAAGAPTWRGSCGELTAWAVATGSPAIILGSMLCGSARAIGMPKGPPPACCWCCCCQPSSSAIEAMPASWTPWPSCGMS